MNILKTSLSTLIVGFVILTNGCNSRGEVIEDWITGSSDFKVRITAYRENSSWLAGTIYDFQATSGNTSKWNHVLTYRIDDPGKIPRDNLHFLAPQIGYFFIGSILAVTTDAGGTWHLWDAEKDLPDKQDCKYPRIKQVQIGTDGGGDMGVDAVIAIVGKGNRAFDLSTKDYGKTWSIKPKTASQ
jgi:hypothetical protein